MAYHFSQGSAVEKIHTQKNLLGAKSGADCGQPACTRKINQEIPSMLNEQFMTSFIAELSLEDEIPVATSNFERVKRQGIPDQIIPLGQYANCTNNSVLPSYDAANSLNNTNFVRLPPNGLDQFSVKINSQENMHLADQINIQRVHSSLHAHGMDVGSFPHPQHHPGRQCSLHRMHLHELSHSHMPWLHFEENDFKHQYLGLPLYNSYDNLSQISFHNCKMIHRGLMGSSPCQYCVQGFSGRSASCLFEHDQNLFCPTHTQLDLSAEVFDAIQVGKVWEKTLNSKSFEKDELANHTKVDGRVISDGPVNFDIHFQSFEPSQSHGLDFWGQYTDSKCGEVDYTKLQTQAFDLMVGLTGRVYDLAKDPYGCRILQRNLIEGTKEDVEKIFLEIIGHIPELMMHRFGNYLIQKLVQVCDEDQMSQIVYAITIKSGELVRLSCNNHGTRSVQEVIRATKSSEQVSRIVSSLRPGIMDLIKDPNGYHVAKHCLEYFMPEYVEFLFEAAAIAHCVELATNRHGCCVLKNCLNHFAGELRHRTISEIVANAVILSQDPFGNYVVQHVIELEISWATLEVLKQLEGCYGYLSKQKFGSNVVEKCLKYAAAAAAGEEQPQLRLIIQEFIDCPQLDQIIQDQFGNFVIQTALNLSKGTLHSALIEAIRPHIKRLRSSPFGRKVLSCHGFKETKRNSYLPP